MKNISAENESLNVYNRKAIDFRTGVNWRIENKNRFSINQKEMCHVM